MNADRRIVPAKHVSSVLAEEHISERTIEIKNTLKESGNKLDNVAHKWMENDGMNPLARVIINNVHEVPQKKSHKPQVHNHSGHEAHHGHDTHGHGHEAHSGFASFIHTGHWFGDHGAWIFGMIGRYLGEVLGYTLKLLAVLLVFWPTRTAILTAIIIWMLNIWTGTALSVWLSAGACLILHGIFSFTTKMSGENSGWHGWWHEHGGHWHH